jgi:hypothetical protein
VLRCIEIAMQPIRYAGGEELFQERRHALNERLMHIGFAVGEEGKLAITSKASTVSEARERTRRSRGKLESIGA